MGASTKSFPLNGRNSKGAGCGRSCGMGRRSCVGPVIVPSQVVIARFFSPQGEQMRKVHGTMPLEIVSYSSEHTAPVAAFNERVQAQGAPFELSKSPLAEWLPKGDGARVWQEFFLALDGADVRGGFTLRRQEFWLRGAV